MDCGILASRGQYGQSFAVESKVLYLGETAADQSCYQHKVQTEKTESSVCPSPCRLYYKLKPSCSFFSPGKLINIAMHGNCFSDRSDIWDHFKHCTAMPLWFDVRKYTLTFNIVSKPLSYKIHVNIDIFELFFSLKACSCSIRTWFSNWVDFV